MLHDTIFVVVITRIIKRGEGMEIVLFIKIKTRYLGTMMMNIMIMIMIKIQRIEEIEQDDK